MKPRLQATLGQQLVMTPQLRQAIRLLQLSAAELDVEIAQAVESNPLLDWTETGGTISVDGGDGEAPATGGKDEEAFETQTLAPAEADWGPGDGEAWYERTGPADPEAAAPAAEQVPEGETLQDHLLWQLHLSPLSPRDRVIGVTLIEAIEDDGYLREPLENIAASLAPEIQATVEEIQTVVHQIQQFDPV